MDLTHFYFLVCQPSKHQCICIYPPHCTSEEWNLWPACKFVDVFVCCVAHLNFSTQLNISMSQKGETFEAWMSKKSHILERSCVWYLGFSVCTLISPCHSGLAISAIWGLTPPDNGKHCVSSSLTDHTGNTNKLFIFIFAVSRGEWVLWGRVVMSQWHRRSALRVISLPSGVFCTPC